MRKRKATTDEQPLLLTVEEARGLLQIGRDAMRGLIANNLVQTITFGRSVRVPRQALLDFIDAQTKKAG